MVIVYESLSEKFNLIRRNYDDGMVQLKLHLHHGAPTIDELVNAKNIKEVIKRETKYIDVMVNIMDCDDGRFLIKMNSKDGLTSEDIEDVINYLPTIENIGIIDYEIDLQDEEIEGDLRYFDHDNGYVEIKFYNKDGVESICCVQPNDNIALYGYYDPTTLLGLSRVAHNFIFRKK
jgi:hypothetical protein